MDTDAGQSVVAGPVGAAVEELLAEVMPEQASGTVLVAAAGEIVYVQGFGAADREAGTPCRPDTVHCLGSITKQFTAAAIVKLEMMGMLAVTDPIAALLGGVPTDKRLMTLHHLLTHTAGLIGDLGDDYSPMRRDEVVGGALSSDLSWPPGTRHRYSNLGYSVLAAVVEIVSGIGYEQFLAEHLFGPAGMTDTGYMLPDWSPERLAIGYQPDGTRWGTPLDHPWDTDGPYWNLRGNGGIMSTAYDMYRWHLALDDDIVLSKEASRKLFSPYAPEDESGDSYYGYGWAIRHTDWGSPLVSHNGSNGFMFADYWRLLDEEMMIFMATNDVSKLGGPDDCNLTSRIANHIHAQSDR